MKQLTVIVLVLLLAGSCKLLMVGESKADLADYTSKENTVYYKDKPLAKLQAVTYSLDGGEMVRELNFKLIDEEGQQHIDNLIRFVAEGHEGDEVEVEVDIKGSF